MGSPRRSTASARGNRRQQLILDELERLLVDNALSEVSVEEIATGAGISRAQFYAYFDSKHDALAAALERVSREILDRYAAPGSWLVRSGADSPREAMLRTWRDVIPRWQKHGPVLREAADLWNSVPQVRVQYEALIGRFIDEISGQIERERARGVAPPGPEARGLATMLMWQAERVLLLTLVDAAHAIDQETLIDTAVTLWLRVIYSESDPAVGAES